MPGVAPIVRVMLTAARLALRRREGTTQLAIDEIADMCAACEKCVADSLAI